MNKLFILLLAIVIATPAVIINAQEPELPAANPAENVLCSTLLPGNSVTAPFYNVTSLELDDIQRNDNVNLPIRVTNRNSFPIQNATVHLRLFEIGNEANQRIEPQLYMTEIVDTDVTLAANGSTELNHTFTIPTFLSNGDYYLSTYVESEQRFPLSGDSAFHTDFEQPIAFTLSAGQSSGPTIDRTSLTVNGTLYPSTDEQVSAFASSTIINGIETTSITVVVKNEAGAGPAIGTFTWEVFAGDQPNPVTLTDTTQAPIKLVPGTQTNITYQLLNPIPTDYTIVGTLSTENSRDQSVIVVLGEDDSVIARPVIIDPIDFAAFSTNAENETSLRFCYTPATLLQYENPALEFAVTGSDGIISEYSINPNTASPSSESIVDSFTFPSVPGDYTVDIAFLSADRIVATATLQYQLNTTENTNEIITSSGKGVVNYLLVTAFIALGALIIYGLLFYRRSFYKLKN